MLHILDGLIRKLNDSDFYSFYEISNERLDLLTCDTPVAKYLRVTVNFSAGVICGRKELL